jgi:hypothetical protein
MLLNEQCAVGTDGTTLLNAKDITWFHNPDDNTLLPSTSHTSFPSPAIIVAGSHRSARVPRPASKLTDPNNTVLGKCKATHHVVISKGEDESNEDAVAEVPECNDDEDPHTDEDTCTDDAPPSTYQQTKEMGDADREVSKSFKLLPSNKLISLCRVPNNVKVI